jgi:cellulose synthase/poly-beta-1,6-N-acetylglucosamine synthase-like glycosyltransferase
MAPAPLPISPSSPMLLMSLIDRLLRRKSHMTVDLDYVNYKVAAIIPAFNEEGMLPLAVNSVLQQTRKVRRIFIVDDMSTDRTQEIAQNLAKRNRNIVYIRNEIKRGKAGGINYVLRHVSEEVVVVVDADTILDKNFVENILKSLRFTEAAGATGYVVPYAAKKSDSPYVLHRATTYLYMQEVEKRAQESVNGIIVLAGCAVAFKRKALLEVGGMPRDTITEDMDLTWRFLEKGWRVIYCKNAYALTDEPESFTSYRTQLNRWYGGFFECLHVHGRKVFQSKPLGFSIIFGILEGLWLPIFLVYLVHSVLDGDLMDGALVLSLNFFIMLAFVIRSARRTGRGWSVFKGLPVSLIMMIVDTVIWNKCMIHYGILGKKVRTWNMSLQRTG